MLLRRDSCLSGCRGTPRLLAQWRLQCRAKTFFKRSSSEFLCDEYRSVFACLYARGLSSPGSWLSHGASSYRCRGLQICISDLLLPTFPCVTEQPVERQGSTYTRGDPAFRPVRDGLSHPLTSALSGRLSKLKAELDLEIPGYGMYMAVHEKPCFA